MKRNKKYPSNIEAIASGVYAGPPLDDDALSRIQIKKESVEFSDVYGGPEMMGFRPAPNEEPEVAEEPENAAETAAEPETEPAAVAGTEPMKEADENNTKPADPFRPDNGEGAYPPINQQIGLLTYAGPAFYNRNNSIGFMNINMTGTPQNNIVSNNDNIPKKGDKYCRACGAALLPNAKFCIECGAGVEA